MILKVELRKINFLKKIKKNLSYCLSAVGLLSFNLFDNSGVKISFLTSGSVSATDNWVCRKDGRPEGEMVLGPAFTSLSC